MFYFVSLIVYLKIIVIWCFILVTAKNCKNYYQYKYLLTEREYSEFHMISTEGKITGAKL